MLDVDTRFGMDESILRCLSATPSPDQQAKALQYFEELKLSDVGWQICLQAITSRIYSNDHIQFFCLQVIEHFTKCRYASAQPQERQILRDFLCQWTRFEMDSSYHSITPQSSFLKNKIAQITALVFIQDYPARWPTFFNNVLFSCVQMGESSVDHYLRVLLAIDSEIADREITRTNMEVHRNTIIKDAMRENVINSLVDSWYTILTTYEKVNPSIVCRCLNVIGVYILWIDINLVANDRFVPLLVRELSIGTMREAAADCIHGIIIKGMEPLLKTKLVESFNTVLTNVGAWNIIRTSIDDQSDPEYISKLGKILNAMGINLIDCYHKVSKSESKDSENCRAILHAVESKVNLALDFLGFPYDEVSSSVFDFVRDYLHLIKAKPMINEVEKQYLLKTLQTVTQKMRFDDDYDFEHEGEDEAIFLGFRKLMKVLFDNIASIDRNLVVEHVQNIVILTLQNWKKLAFEDVEIALYLMYLLGDVIPGGITNFSPTLENSSPIQIMLIQMINSEAHLHSNPGVVLQFFENVLKFDKFFLVHPENIVTILSAFLKNNGLFHRSSKVRSRCAYIFSKFIKTVKGQLLPNVTDNILHAIQPLLNLEAPFKSQEHERIITEDDQVYLYEVVGLVIVGGESSSQKKAEFMRHVITPLLEMVRIITDLLPNEKDQNQRHKLATILVRQAISVTGRLSKAFSSQQSMKACGCIPVFTDAIGVFLTCLEIPSEEQLIVLQGAVRQYLHRMVMCLEEELLPYIPVASQGLLKGGDPKSIQEYIPLINQVIHKYKKDVAPFLQQFFTPMVSSIFTALAVPVEANDQQAIREQQLMQRQYFNFVAAIVTNNLTEVLSSQDPQILNQVMRTVMQGAVEFPDPVAQKACFSILKKLVELWGGQDGPEGFIDFMYNDIVPACFMAPMKPSFDITDAQTLIVLNETSTCLRSVYDKRKEEFIVYLQSRYLPTLDLPLPKIQELIQALQSSPKDFKQYMKTFFTQAKS